MCKKHILFLHALTGCDTTSAFYKKGKNKFPKLFESRIDLQNAAFIFTDENADVADVLQSGILCNK